ncbi:RrF2 family transcriptional regulator [Flavobacterium nackdongense]|uniref:Rrf2 family transcriptional regulator n=1 Tax=Flavobacterium nackdongense TaxID=2547394 RepID=A0A4P6YD56_9FLAO|nr:Rrf2 family transcriptional regulator [Flavobacterium nackdongense]QBN18607.1 Rrf2 family transcriptional regulator [Flavobacterium nackdongense]
MFSKTCEYAIRATIYIATQSYENKRVTIKEIAENIDSPLSFTAKILQVLAKKGIVQSIKGIGGGFEIPKEDIKKISLSQIVTAIDGDVIFTGCGLGLHHCSQERPCPLNKKFKSIREDLAKMLESTYLEELALDINSGDSFLT